MKLIYTDTNGNGITNVIHAHTCKEGQVLLRKAQGTWNWDIIEAGTRAEVVTTLDGIYRGTIEGDFHYCPCVTIQ